MGVTYIRCGQFKYLCLNHKKIMYFHVVITSILMLILKHVNVISVWILIDESKK
jgi:hypothetical protein